VTASLQSRVSLISSGDDGETNVVFEKGTFVAFIDTREETEDRFEEFRIGKVSTEGEQSGLPIRSGSDTDQQSEMPFH